MLAFKPTVVTTAISLVLLNSSAIAATPKVVEHRDDGALVPRSSNSQNPILQDIYQQHPSLVNDSSNNDSKRVFERAISDAHKKLNESTTANRSGHDIPGGYEPGGGNRSDDFDGCRDFAEVFANGDLNVIYWDGLSLDWTGTRPMIEGTDGSDLIFGTGLDDLIIGYGGQDFLCGGPGQDLIYGDEYEFDSQNPSDGVDYLFGGDNNDVIYGGGRGDYMNGEAGHDTLFGGRHNDIMVGEDDFVLDLFSGDDFLVGMEGSDTYWGEKGNDVAQDVAFFTDTNLHSPTFNMGAGADSCFVYEEFKDDAELDGCDNVYVLDN